jgi:hypothetical protein
VRAVPTSEPRKRSDTPGPARKRRASPTSDYLEQPSSFPIRPDHLQRIARRNEATAGELLDLQQTHGNAFVQRQVLLRQAQQGQGTKPPATPLEQLRAKLVDFKQRRDDFRDAADKHTGGPLSLVTVTVGLKDDAWELRGAWVRRGQQLVDKGIALAQEIEAAAAAPGLDPNKPEDDQAQMEAMALAESVRRIFRGVSGETNPARVDVTAIDRVFDVKFSVTRNFRWTAQDWLDAVLATFEVERRRLQGSSP